MNVTTRGRYALRVMIDLARQPAEDYISLKTVAERQDISMKYLEMIVGQLKKQDLLEASRGKEGGYRLSRRPEDYSVAEILRCLEDSLAPVACLKDGAAGCERAEVCASIPMWRELDELTNNYLEHVSLADLISGERWKSREEEQ